jgi:HNH endonuclease
MPHSPASASGDQPPAELGLTAQDLAARLTAEGELTAEELAGLARLDDGPDAAEDFWDGDPGPCANRDSWDDDPGTDLDRAPRVAEVWDAGFIHNVSGDPGYGFASGGLLDRMLPGRELAAFTGTALGDGLDRLSDYELIGFLCAARRNTSWQQAAQLAAVADLEQRRTGADGTPGEHVADEVGAALKLTPRAAEGFLALAAGVTRLSQVPAALAAGLIDMSRAEVFVRELMPLDDELAVRAEAIVMPRAPDLTTGQLAYALQQAVAAVDPAAAERRKKRAEQDARVEVWMEPGRGTAAVAGRDLPAAEVIAADKRLTAAARWLKARGADGTMDWLRSRAYLAFMNGYSLDGLLAGLLANEAADHDQPVDSSGDVDSCDEAASASGTDSPSPAPSAPGRPCASSSPSASNASGASAADGSAVEATVGDGDTQGTGCPAGGTQVPAELANPADPPGLAALAGTVNLTMPASAWLGLSDAPGEAGGFGALDAGTCRDLTAALAANPATRWCVTLVSTDGRPVAHGCARAGPGPPGNGDPAAWLATVKITPIEAGACEHRRESAGYQPSNTLRHVIKIRSRRCGFPGCRRPAVACDDDHTIPYDKGGRTCECNLHPLCRRHHQAKQARGWRLEQPEPGTLIWTLPSGHQYTVIPEPYPL